MSEHTPTPWKADCIDTFGYKPRIYGQLDRSGGKLISEVGNAEDALSAQDEWDANAKLIVQSVNAFAALADHLGCDPAELEKVNLVALVTAAQEARNYFEPLMDADQPSGSQPMPNDEMRLYLELDQALPHDTVDRADKE